MQCSCAMPSFPYIILIFFPKRPSNTHYKSYACLCQMVQPGQTDTHTDGTIFIPSTADAGGNEQNLWGYMMIRMRNHQIILQNLDIGFLQSLKVKVYGKWLFADTITGGEDEQRVVHWIPNPLSTLFWFGFCYISPGTLLHFWRAYYSHGVEMLHVLTPKNHTLSNVNIAKLLNPNKLKRFWIRCTARCE